MYSSIPSPLQPSPARWGRFHQSSSNHQQVPLQGSEPWVRQPPRGVCCFLGLRLLLAQTAGLSGFPCYRNSFPPSKTTRSRGHAHGVGSSQIPRCQVLGEEGAQHGNWEMGSAPSSVGRPCPPGGCEFAVLELSAKEIEYLRLLSPASRFKPQ